MGHKVKVLEMDLEQLQEGTGSHRVWAVVRKVQKGRRRKSE